MTRSGAELGTQRVGPVPQMCHASRTFTVKDGDSRALHRPYQRICHCCSHSFRGTDLQAGVIRSAAGQECSQEPRLWRTAADSLTQHHQPSGPAARATLPTCKRLLSSPIGRACPRDAPGQPSTASSHQRQHTAIPRSIRGLALRVTPWHRLVMRRSSVRFLSSRLPTPMASR